MNPISANLQNWSEAALAEVLAAQNGDGGWGYATNRQSNTEATAICALALMVLRPGDAALAPALAFLEARRRADGAFAASVVVAEPTWTTPLAAMPLADAGHSNSAQAAADWLLATPAFVLDPTPVALYGYDTSLPGWPWTVGDYSFVEPTSAALIFLKRQGYAQHERVCRAVEMLRGRTTALGGWNYGEPRILGQELLPAVVPTALALIALADEPDEATTAGLAWLLQQHGTITSLFSLGWAVLALNVWGALDATWTAELMARWNASPPHRRLPMETALCLLGTSPREVHPFAVESSG